MSPTLAERIANGRKARQRAGRSAHAEAGNIRRDPLKLLRASNSDRVEQLVPLRHGRMLESPFAFFRGSAILQAHDLAGTPASGFNFQICGDCHLANFGGFATPERNLLFDLNDFDETHPGPWEWDLKRLVASFAVAGRQLSHSAGAIEELTYRAATSYQRRIQQYAQMSELDIWYDKITFDRLLDTAATPEVRDRLRDAIRRAGKRTHDELLPKMGERVDGRWVLHDAPPAVFHVAGNATLFTGENDYAYFKDWHAYIDTLYREYQSTLDANRRQLFSRFTMQDLAFKVVGIGSIGTRCLILLLVDTHENPMFLQIKQANPSVIASYVPVRARYQHQGRRVVEGQRLMQAASDQFIGWSTGPRGRHFYLRQLRDMKLSAQIELFDSQLLSEYAALCGWVLARAHARAGGMARELAGYLGDGDGFAVALVKYAGAYADQVEKDYERFAAACRSGEVEARTEADYRQDFSV